LLIIFCIKRRVAVHCGPNFTARRVVYFSSPLRWAFLLKRAWRPSAFATAFERTNLDSGSRSTAALSSHRCRDHGSFVGAWCSPARTTRASKGAPKMRFRRFQPGNAGTPLGSKNRTTGLVEQLVSDELEKSPMTEEKELNNQHGIDGIQPSSKSRSRRKPAAGASSRRSRITDTYARALEWKRPNALKHGL
jgi:hypothetical protein